MGNLTNEENWAARERLRRVEVWLWWRGWVGRQDLVEAFNISPAQASGDLQRYAGLNASAMVYQTSRKRYEATEDMVCVLHEPDFEEAVRVFFGGGGQTAWSSGGEARLDVLSIPQRPLDRGVVRRLFVALLGHRGLRMKYANEAWTEVVPTGLAWDGSRWLVRAWCPTRGAWNHFVVGRILEAEWPGKEKPELPEDDELNTEVVIRLRLATNLTENQKKLMRLDYTMRKDRIELRLKKAYLNTFALNLDPNFEIDEIK
jgi:hypothetical protein